ncbi:hypothetical protein D8Y22_05330 [Salinadaptatus halalkaliphilus]|uniref:Uncharacterized protein n=1 Tax=Salinadaptatus halalkaliphilus TaxID=2419781 RepID=A0A4S3TRG3_9EURY|nr:hypothetical protein D8Y22_05330 [Salinadaptatus halalkaliphilus]
MILSRFEVDVGFGVTDLLAGPGLPIAFDRARANVDGTVSLETVDRITGATVSLGCVGDLENASFSCIRSVPLSRLATGR